MITLTQEKREELIKNYTKYIDWCNERLSSCLNDFDRGAIESSKLTTEIALASLTAEPEYYVFKHPNGKLFHSLVDESCKGHDDVYPVYADPPVPEIKFPPEFNESHDSFNEFRRGWNGAISEVKRISGLGE